MQQIGIYVAPGNSNHYSIEMIFDDLSIGPVLDNGTGTDKYIRYIG